MEKIACIGCGSMGGAIMSAICKKFDAKNVTVTTKHFEHAQEFAKKNGCNAAESNSEAVKDAKYIFLAVKPVYIREVIANIKISLNPEAIIISMAAGVSLNKLMEFYDANYIRIMPNMPAQIGEAMTALCCLNEIPSEELKNVTELLESCGKVEKVDENLMDCVTAISGSGPAYAFMFIEALADAAVKFGMPRKQAYIYAAQTLKGSAAMVLKDERCPAALKDAVCSPAGTTIEGVAALEANGFRNAVIEGATAAWKKSMSMGK